MNRRCGALGRLLRVVCAALTGLLVFACVASAATYTVNTTNDSTDSGSCATTCSLRDALTAVNNAGGTDTIVVPSGIYILQTQLPQINNSSLDLTLSGAGARSTTINGNGTSRIFDFTGTGTIAVSGMTVTDGFQNDTVGQPGDFGGAIHDSANSLTLTDMAVTNSVYQGVGGGGGIAVDGNATLTLDRVTVSGNEASYDGGGIYELLNSPVVKLIDSTIANNKVDASLLPNPSTFNESGGGIEIDEGTLQLSNSTIADNTLAAGAAQLAGGGVFDDDPNSPTVQSANTIVAENSPDDCGDQSGGTVPVTSAGPNLDSDSTCFFGASDQHANPLLQSLYPNGGQTDTLALSAYSPAIDRGQNSTCPTVDQRGISRPQGAACDLGAYEATAPLVQTGTASALGSDTATISGKANPDDQAAFAYFQYGTSTAYGFATPGSYVGSLYGDAPLTSDIAGLAPNTTYHFRVVGVSEIGTNYGADQTFTTAAPPPSATTPPTTPTATKPTATTPRPPKCSIQLPSHKVSLSAPKFRVRIVCNQAAAVQLKAVVGETLPAKPAWHRTFSVTGGKASAKRGTALTITLRLPRAALTGLEQHLRETVQITVVARNGNGTKTQQTKPIKLTGGGPA